METEKKIKTILMNFKTFHSVLIRNENEDNPLRIYVSSSISADM